jgi:carnosine N-methyltransferase
MSGRFSEKDVQEEQMHFSNVVTAFQQYAQYSVLTTYVTENSITVI